MRNPSFLGFILGIAMIPFANGTTVTFGVAPTSRTVVDSSNNLVTSASSLIWVGNFTSESFSLNNALTLQQNIVAIQAAGSWERFGYDTVTGNQNSGVSDTVGVSVAPPSTAPNRLGGAITDNNFGATKADYFNGKNLYVWIFNAASDATATEMGIFKATTATVPWLFPTNAGGVGDAVTYSSSTIAASVMAAIGGVGSVPTGQLKLAGVVPVPEPSTFAAGSMLALVAMAVRRRRRG